MVHLVALALIFRKINTYLASDMDTSLHLLITIVLCFLIGWATSYYANQRGRNQYTWFIIGMLFGLFGFIFLFILPSLQKEETIVKNGAPVSEDHLKIFSESASITEETPSETISSVDEYKTKQWFFLDKMHVQNGPCGYLFLKGKWAEGIIDFNTYVWADGMDNWKKIEELPPLFQEMQDQELPE